MNSADYHATRALSSSLINTLLKKNAAAARRQQVAPDGEPTAQQEQGTILHALVLENRDLIAPIDALDFRTKAAQDARDQARQAGRIPIIAHKAGKLSGIAKTAKAAIQAALNIDFESDGTAEYSIFWEYDGVKIKSRLDWLIHDRNLIVDLKFTELSSLAAFERSIPASGYDVQGTLYPMAVSAAYGIPEPRFIFAVVDISDPDNPQTYFRELSAAYRAIARVKIDRAAQIWKACTESNIYPGYPQAVVTLDPPAWELATAEELDAELHGFSKEAFLFGRCAQK